MPKRNDFWMQTASVKNWYKQVLPALAWGKPWIIIGVRAGRIIQKTGTLYQDTLRRHATVEIQRSFQGTVQHNDIFKNT